GVQSCPKSANALVFSEMARSTRPYARRIEGWLERRVEMLRLLTRVKFPSKSNSTLPVSAVLGAASSHSKFAPRRSERVLTWNSGAASGPLSPANPGAGKSLPCGDDESWMRLVLRKP